MAPEGFFGSSYFPGIPDSRLFSGVGNYREFPFPGSRPFHAGHNPNHNVPPHALSLVLIHTGDPPSGSLGFDAPLGPVGFEGAQHSPTTRPSVERTADKAFLLLDRV